MSAAPGAERRSPLHDEHVALGAALTPFAGWTMPLRYAGDRTEHLAVRSAAGLFDLSHMGELRVTGAGAPALLDQALVGHLSAVAVGRARYTMLCAPDGGIVDDLVVYRTGDDDFLVVANAANSHAVLAALDTLAAGRPDVRVADESAATALVAVQGPRAAAVVTSLAAPDDVAAVTDLRYYAGLPATVAGVPALVARTGYTGEDGFELFVPADAASGLWRALLDAGSPHGLVPAGLAARDTLRLEAGMPLYGHELDRTTTPYDAGLGRVVRLDKSEPDGAPLDFVGRDALAARADAVPDRVLVGLQGLGRRAARAGYPVVRRGDEGADGGGDEPGDVVGRVTSGAPSPTLGHPVAMAFVTPEEGEPGTDLGVDVRGRTEPVRVVALPFYRRSS
ncbi:glycine cleavage system aminomethyltransferase GcvT [Cellulomonas sp. ATA003]|uniref:glycine cleavage system aminomethyltransferase GcvT n=1 Tax=Cellulomonas sp. ATA003 TaxID=3073064 RepID=UPI002873760F|nr:glycine cleavage system aminomethyltransferase GcvT [Cellulomonas sp. ATA003]WNB85566.1 glycine cleavage system aminomethyltransferase GcvT [Cellulomonas sp. ATA003]